MNIAEQPAPRPDWCERPNLWIGGDWVAPSSSRRLDVVSPSTEQVLGFVPDANADDVDAAVTAARAALHPGSEWSGWTAADRADAMERLADELQSLEGDLAVLLGHEIGRPVGGPARPSRPAELLRYFAGQARTALTSEIRVVPEQRPPHAIQHSVVRRSARGVTAAIVPYNGTLPLGLYKVGPTLAAGGSVVLKAPPQAPLEAFVFAEAASRTGIPAGVINIVTGGAAAGQSLVAHPGVDIVGFTGSTEVGRAVAVACADRLCPVVLELGGKSAAIVLADADIERLARAVPFLAYTFTGQNCFIHSRFIVHRSRFAEVAEMMASVTDRLAVGDPFALGTELGPVISADHRDRINSRVAEALSNGARAITRSRQLPDIGYYVEPTVLVDAENSMRICQEETFGPVITLLSADSDEHAVALGNDSDYGLAGSVWGEDAERAWNVATQVRTGSIGINGYGFNTAAPLVGWGMSGLGVELGPEGMEQYLALQSVHLTGGAAPSGSWVGRG
jgi:aldehyde dehydrogenase (NAD+)